MGVLGSDIYQIQNYTNELIKENINENENTLAMGIFGYLSDSFSHLMQNNIIVASEYINEMFPTRVKYEKNILDHAMLYNVSEVNAKPATIDVIMCLLETDVVANMKDNKLIIDRDHSIYIGDFEFHLEYDIILSRSILLDNSIMYTAMYDNSRINSISSIDSIYLTTPYRQVENGYRYIFLTCKLRQVTYSEVYKKVISANSITNKTLEFEFGDQLATFDISYKRGDEIGYITPLLKGSSSAGIEGKYCYYSYINSNNIRLLFDDDSFLPRINDEITIFIQGTRGAEGNFEYVDDIITTISSEEGGYTNIATLIKPLTDSQYGEDKISMEELKKIVPREALSRGSITTTTDLYNYFNTITTETNKLTFIKKADNQFERLFYSYLLIKNSEGVIVPSNTINLNLLYRDSAESTRNDFDSINDNRCIIKPGTHFKLSKEGNGNWIGTRVNEGEDFYFENEDDNESGNDFVYSSPFLTIINLRPLLYISYYLNIVNKKYPLLTTSNKINQASNLQFIALNCNWKRKYKDNIYKLKFQCTQNINEYRGLITIDEEGNPILDENGNYYDRKIRSVLVLRNGTKGDSFVEGNLTNYIVESGMYVYEFEFELSTEDYIDAVNNIEINNAYGASNEAIININISDVYTSNIVPNATGQYILSTYDAVRATWNRTVGDETFSISHTEAYNENISAWGWDSHLHLNELRDIEINNKDNIIPEEAESLVINNINFEASVSLNKGIGEYIKIPSYGTDLIKWKREVDKEIYIITYDKLNNDWYMDIDIQLDLSYATLSDAKVENSETYSRNLIVSNVYYSSPVRDIEGTFGRSSNSIDKTTWNMTVGLDEYTVTHDKTSKEWSLQKIEYSSLSLDTNNIDKSPYPVTVSSVFDDEGNYIEDAEGVYNQTIDNSTLTQWEHNKNGDVYIIKYDKQAQENKWSLSGPGREYYPIFTYNTYTVPTITIIKATDLIGNEIPLAKGVYSLYESSENYDSWKMDKVNRTYVVRFDKNSGMYFLSSYINYSDFSIDQTAKNSFASTTGAEIFILYKDEGESKGLMGLDQIVPDSYPLYISDYTVSNIYYVADSQNKGGIEFFFNYTDIVSSNVTVHQERDEDRIYQYLDLRSVPLIRAAYLDENDSNVDELIDILETKRAYIENALDVLEDQFGIDFKFYNTYGPSLIFKLDSDSLDRVDITLDFDIAFKAGADKTNVILVKNDIKGYIEDLNNTENNLHISNIITPITNKYYTDTLDYIEFLNINKHNTGKQFLHRIPENEIEGNIPPEFINIRYKYEKEDGKMVNKGMGININTIG